MDTLLTTPVGLFPPPPATLTSTTLPPVVKPAGAWGRHWAFVIDGFVYGLPVLVISIIWLTLSGARFSLKTIESHFSYEILVVGFYFIYTIFLTGRYGKTIGKDAYGFEVIDYKTKQKAFFWRIVVRELVKIGVVLIPFVGGLIYLINILIIIFSKDKRGLHDMISRTQVLQTKPAWKMTKQFKYFGGYLLLCILLYWVLASLQNLLHPYLPVPTTKVSTNPLLWKEFQDTRHGWTIKYDGTKYRTPLVLSDEMLAQFGRPDQVAHPNIMYFDRATNLDSFCLDSFSVDTLDNPQNLSLTDWLAQHSSQALPQTITIGQLTGVKLTYGSSYQEITNQGRVTRSTKLVRYTLPYLQKIFILEYHEAAWEYSPEECSVNEAALEQIFQTFKPL